MKVNEKQDRELWKRKRGKNIERNERERNKDRSEEEIKRKYDESEEMDNKSNGQWNRREE